MELEKEHQWLEIADYLIKRYAIRRRLLDDMRDFDALAPAVEQVL
jgi:hypothetical protein